LSKSLQSLSRLKPNLWNERVTFDLPQQLYGLGRPQVLEQIDRFEHAPPFHRQGRLTDFLKDAAGALARFERQAFLQMALQGDDGQFAEFQQIAHGSVAICELIGIQFRDQFVEPFRIEWRRCNRAYLLADK